MLTDIIKTLMLIRTLKLESKVDVVKNIHEFRFGKRSEFENIIQVIRSSSSLTHSK